MNVKVRYLYNSWPIMIGVLGFYTRLPDEPYFLIYWGEGKETQINVLPTVIPSKSKGPVEIPNYLPMVRVLVYSKYLEELLLVVSHSVVCTGPKECSLCKYRLVCPSELWEDLPL